MKKLIHYTLELFVNLPLGIVCIFLAVLFDNIDRYAWKNNKKFLKNGIGRKLDDFVDKLSDIKWKMHEWAYK